MFSTTWAAGSCYMPTLEVLTEPLTTTSPVNHDSTAGHTPPRKRRTGSSTTETVKTMSSTSSNGANAATLNWLGQQPVWSASNNPSDRSLRGRNRSGSSSGTSHGLDNVDTEDIYRQLEMLDQDFEASFPLEESFEIEQVEGADPVVFASTGCCDVVQNTSTKATAEHHLVTPQGVLRDVAVSANSHPHNSHLEAVEAAYLMSHRNSSFEGLKFTGSSRDTETVWSREQSRPSSVMQYSVTSQESEMMWLDADTGLPGVSFPPLSPKTRETGTVEVAYQSAGGHNTNNKEKVDIMEHIRVSVVTPPPLPAPSSVSMTRSSNSMYLSPETVATAATSKHGVRVEDTSVKAVAAPDVPSDEEEFKAFDDWIKHRHSKSWTDEGPAEKNEVVKVMDSATTNTSTTTLSTMATPSPGSRNRDISPAMKSAGKKSPEEDLKPKQLLNFFGLGARGNPRSPSREGDPPGDTRSSSPSRGQCPLNDQGLHTQTCVVGNDVQLKIVKSTSTDDNDVFSPELSLPVLEEDEGKQETSPVSSPPRESRKLPTRTLMSAQQQLNLGMTQLSSNEVGAAIQSLSAAAHGFALLHKPIAQAKSLNMLGIAAARSGQWDMALPSLYGAFETRRKFLGQWHVDTVDSLNNLGNVYWRMGNAEGARRCYWMVFWVRRAVFGVIHPSVAVSAHDVANSLRLSGRYTKAQTFYRASMEIYEKLGISRSNPAIGNLLKDIKHLQEAQKKRNIVDSLETVQSAMSEHVVGPPAPRRVTSVGSVSTALTTPMTAPPPPPPKQEQQHSVAPGPRKAPSRPPVKKSNAFFGGNSRRMAKRSVIAANRNRMAPNGGTVSVSTSSSSYRMAPSTRAQSLKSRAVSNMASEF